MRFHSLYRVCSRCHGPEPDASWHSPVQRDRLNAPTGDEVHRAYEGKARHLVQCGPNCLPLLPCV